jgi:hypothetical protein
LTASLPHAYNGLTPAATSQGDTVTRKHFEAIARSINVQRRNATLEEVQGIDMVIRALVQEFSLINPRFDAAKFRAACFD